MATSTGIKLSIIIATYNWPEALELILANLVPQLINYSNTELIIADDGSTKATADVVQKYQNILPRIRHIWHEDAGFRKACILNKAVLAASGEYLAFLDGDCIPFPDYIEQTIKLAENGYFIAGNRVLLARALTYEVLTNSKIITNMFGWRFWGWLNAKLKKDVNKLLPWLRLKSGVWRYSRSTNWKYPKGCNFALWRKDFIAVNGFDESFSGWGHEDADLFIRLLHSGLKIKDGRFATPVLHLWHKEQSRALEKANWQIVLKRLNDPKFTLAKVGLNKHANIV
jgi:glycosyltransferase involved in cell wall biosynthesis